MTSPPSRQFCIEKAAEILTHAPDRALEAIAWTFLGISAVAAKADFLSANVASAAVEFMTDTSATTFSNLHSAVTELLNAE